MQNRLAAAVCTCVMVVSFGCTDTGAPITEPSSSIVSRTLSDQEETVDRISRAFALALQDRGLRIQLRNAWRSSRVTEHKLVLQEFIQTPQGRGFVTAAARAAGIDQNEFERMLGGLPPMDFYLPWRDHRRTWKATSDLVVVGLMESDPAQFSGYTPDGRTITYDESGRTPELVYIVLHPAEPKGIRANPQADSPGEVIQERNDGEISGRIVKYLPSGDSIVTQLADVLRSQGSRGARQTTAASSTSGTWLRWFRELQGESSGDWETELRFVSKTAMYNGQELGGYFEQYGVVKNNDYYPAVNFAPDYYPIIDGDYAWLDCDELDFGGMISTHWAGMTYWYVNDAEVNKTLYKNNVGYVNARLGWP